MRNLQDYQEHYKAQPYERYQVFFRRRKIREILSSNKHNILLEIGCGLDSIFNDIDSFQSLFVAEPAESFYVKAISDRSKNIAKDRIHIVNKYIEDCQEEFKGISFDLIIVSCLLHEILDPNTFLKAVHSIADANTLIHISVPNAKSFHRVLAAEMGLIENVYQMSESNTLFQQNTIFSLDTLKELLRRSNFQIVDSGTYSFKPFTHQQMEDMIQANLITDQMLEGFYKMEKHIPEMGSEIFVNVTKQ